MDLLLEVLLAQKCLIQEPSISQDPDIFMQLADSQRSDRGISAAFGHVGEKVQANYDRRKAHRIVLQLPIDLARNISFNNFSIGEHHLNAILLNYAVPQPLKGWHKVMASFETFDTRSLQVIVFPEQNKDFTEPIHFPDNDYFGSDERWREWKLKGLILANGPMERPLDISALTGSQPTYSALFWRKRMRKSHFQSRSTTSICWPSRHSTWNCGSTRRVRTRPCACWQ